ncbi:hypothetical protein [Psychromonas sp.]|uniref:hypothetical protein n=1 Tax=Psychromonas sp. TaxID=1884585 RepID=UPI003564EEA2
MHFHNAAGQVMRLADNLTLKELAEMGIELTISEKVDPNHELWLSDEDLEEDPDFKK